MSALGMQHFCVLRKSSVVVVWEKEAAHGEASKTLLR